MEKTITAQELFNKVETLNKTMHDLHLYGQGRIPQLWVDGFFESEVKTYEDFKKHLEEDYIEEVSKGFTGNLEIEDGRNYAAFVERDFDNYGTVIEIRIY